MCSILLTRLCHLYMFHFVLLVVRWSPIGLLMICCHAVGLVTKLDHLSYGQCHCPSMGCHLVMVWGLGCPYDPAKYWSQLLEVGIPDKVFHTSRVVGEGSDK